jgi:hypothetical protein
MKIIDVSVENIIGWDMVLIENNVGYGLWYPFKEDQKIREYERSEIEKVGISPFNWGQDLRKIMYAFSTGASSFYKKIHGKVPSIKPLEEIKPIYSISSLLYSLDDKISLEALKQKGIAGLSESLTKILTKYLGADKINNWRGEWNDDTSTEIVNELSKLVNINQTSIWLKLKKETGLSTQILSKILDKDYLKRIYAEVCDIIFTERLFPEFVIYPPKYFPNNIDVLLDNEIYAFIFDGFLGRADDIYTLMHSSYIAFERRVKDLKISENPKVVIGVNKDWLNTDGKILRMMMPVTGSVIWRSRKTNL